MWLAGDVGTTIVFFDSGEDKVQEGQFLLTPFYSATVFIKKIVLHMDSRGYSMDCLIV